jgi:hypothetical protein
VRTRPLVALAVWASVSACGCGAENEANSASRPSSTTTSLPEIQEPPPTPEGLLGTWSRVGSAGLIRFAKSGEFRIARNEPDLLNAPYAVGTYEVAGRTITLEGGCNSVWEAGLADDELHIVVVEEGCELILGQDLRFLRIPDR